MDKQLQDVLNKYNNNNMGVEFTMDTKYNHNPKLKIQVLNEEMKEMLPTYATEGSAGLDLRACIATDDELEEDYGFGENIILGSTTTKIKKGIALHPNRTALINTGVALSIPKGYAGFILPRSGLGTKNGIILGNGTGVIDSDYTGMVKICLWNRSDTPFTINHGDRIAQLVILPVPTMDIEVVDSLDETVRGSQGFGSSGVK